MIRDSVVEDVWDLINTLRDKDREEIRRSGGIPNKVLFDSFNVSVLRRSFILDGEVVAMWGVRGNVLGYYGIPYLLTGYGVEKLSPIVFARMYRKEVQGMRKIFPVLENYVDATYESAIKMLRIAGFEIFDPIKINNADFCKFRLVSHV